jgi:hypothetical protein
MEVNRRVEMTSRAKTTSILVAATFLWFQTPVCVADEASSSVTAQFMNNPNLPVIVRGDYFKAIQVAYKDFSIILAERAKGTLSSNTELSKQADWISKVENYDIHVKQTASEYTVWFRPTMRNTDHIVMGGGVTYTIDQKTFTITNTVRSK